MPTGKEILDAVLYLGGFLTEAYGMREGGADLVVEGDAAEEDEDAGDAIVVVDGQVPSVDEVDEEWVVVDEEEDDGLRVEDVQWELRRRRKR